MSKDFQSDDILGRWLNGTLTPEEEKELEAHPDFNYYKRLVEAADKIKKPTLDAEKSFERLMHRQDTSENSSQFSKGRKKARQFKYMAAASIVFLLGLAWLLYQISGSQREFRAMAGTKQSVILEDGTTMRLNAGSHAAYSENDSSKIVTLHGEGYFDVQKDGRDFIVLTQNGNIKVLGTSFNIYSRDSMIRIACISGKVHVNLSNHPGEHILTSGKALVSAGANDLSLSKFDSQEVLDWLSNKSVFYNSTLAEVLAELERQYDIKFDVPSTLLNQKQTISTSFPHDDIDIALKITLGALKEVQYKREGQNIILRKK